MSCQLVLIEVLQIVNKNWLKTEQLREKNRNYLIEDFGFAEHRENSTYGFGNQITLQKRW